MGGLAIVMDGLAIVMDELAIVIDGLTRAATDASGSIIMDGLTRCDTPAILLIGGTPGSWMDGFLSRLVSFDTETPGKDS